MSDVDTSRIQIYKIYDTHGSDLFAVWELLAVGVTDSGFGIDKTFRRRALKRHGLEDTKQIRVESTRAEFIPGEVT